MIKLFGLTKGKKRFWACKYDCGLYTIDRITKGFGGTVAAFQSFEELQRYAQENGYKCAKELFCSTCPYSEECTISKN